jgi:ParB family chromosome partitioning protein
MGEHPLGRPEPNAERGEKLQWISPELLVCHPYQPRKRLDPAALEELAASIEKQGILQPLVARKIDDRYELIAGQRRWQAALRLGLKEVPVILRQATDRELLEFSLVENLQRAQLTPLEEARSYQMLLEDFGATQEEIAQRVGKSRATIANALRLLSLPQDLQDLVEEGSLTSGHAKALLSLEDVSLQRELAFRIVREGWNVRETENWVRRAGQGRQRTSVPRAEEKESSLLLKALERKLQERFGRKVEVQSSGEGGWIRLFYYSTSDLEELLGLLGFPPEEEPS